MGVDHYCCTICAFIYPDTAGGYMCESCDSHYCEDCGINNMRYYPDGALCSRCDYYSSHPVPTDSDLLIFALQNLKQTRNELVADYTAQWETKPVPCDKCKITSCPLANTRRVPAPPGVSYTRQYEDGPNPNLLYPHQQPFGYCCICSDDPSCCAVLVLAVEPQIPDEAAAPVKKMKKKY